jgi:acetyl-CoA acetyltransferase
MVARDVAGEHAGRSLAGVASIVGVGATQQGELPGRSANAIAIEALKQALADAGITKDDLDGLITCKPFGSSEGIDTQIGAMVGINPSYSATLEYGTCNFSLHLAAMAIQAGLATTIALLYGTNQRTSGQRFTSVADSGDRELLEPYGFVNIAGVAALAARRRMHLFGLTEAELGQVAVVQRQHARLNPLSIFREKLTIDDYLALPYLVAPLRRPDVCMISDGGVCLIVTTADRAVDFPHRPVEILAGAQQTGLRYLANEDQLLRPWADAAVSRLYVTAGLTPADVDVFLVQDATSVAVLEALELYRFCGVGESGAYVAAGHTALGGRLPTNTNGGQLSEAYMWGWLHLYEAVVQLRGLAGPRQVEGATTALYASTQGYRRIGATLLGRR